MNTVKYIIYIYIWQKLEINWTEWKCTEMKSARSSVDNFIYRNLLIKSSFEELVFFSTWCTFIYKWEWERERGGTLAEAVYVQLALISKGKAWTCSFLHCPIKASISI